MRLVLIGVLSLLAVPQTARAQTPPPTESNAEWTLGAFLDLGYSKDGNSPANHLFRSRGTTPRVDELNLNMAGGYLRKKATTSSRWGLELTGQAGEDAKGFGFSATAPNVSGAGWLLHLGPTNLSYLAPVGNGLTVQGGIFNSFIGYDSLYAKDNLTYTRPWGADFTPYLMLGVNAGYPVTDSVTATAFVINGYWHLAHANDVPSVGGQLAYKASDRMTVKHTVLYGPHQTNTSVDHWRFLSDTVVERKTGIATAALEFQVAEEKVDVAGQPRAWWISAQLPVRWVVRRGVSATVRPEFCWDSRGRWTASEQSVRAITTTLEYHVPFGPAQGIVRLEYRYDHSTGADGGFFADGEVQPGVAGRTPGQQLLVFGAILTFEASPRR